MQTIVVPTDFSQEARNASLYAAELAKAFNARLVLFHAYMLPTPVSEVPYVMVTVDELQKENETSLKKEAEHLSQLYSVETESIVRIGIPSDEIRVLTEDLSIDLIVMGMKGAGRIDKWIGSTATNAIRKLKAPVLVIPHDSKFTAIRNITYASDFSYSSSKQLFEVLLKFAEAFRAKIHIVNVLKQNESLKTGQIALRKGIEDILKPVEYTFDDITHQSIMQGISEYMENHSSELLVMVEHKHSFFERIFSRDHTTAMAYQTKTPLLVLQDKS